MRMSSRTKEIIMRIEELERKIARLEERVQIYAEMHEKYFKLILLLVSVIAALTGLKMAVP